MNILYIFKVLTPKKYNDIYLYDMPPSRYSPAQVSVQADPNCYDTPPQALPVCTKNCHQLSPRNVCASPILKEGAEDYDVPRPLHHKLTPSSSASSLTAESVGSNRSSLIPDYDIPRGQRPVTVMMQQTYDVPPMSHLKELPLELSFALETLEKLQNEAITAITKLLSFVSPNWRTIEKLELHLMDIKLAVIRHKTSLHDFAQFCLRVLGNASRATNKHLTEKLLPLTSSLQSSDNLISEMTEKLQRSNWSLKILAVSDDRFYQQDELDQIITCSRSLIEDIRQISCFIHGNGTLLFKKNSSRNPSTDNLATEHDYIKLDCKDLEPDELRQSNETNNRNESLMLAENEKEILLFFSGQAVTYHNHLTQAIDAFLQAVEHNQLPKVFLAHCKFVVLSAHKLVYIADAVHRSVSEPDIKVAIMNNANGLAEALASNVLKTKQAALQFPSVTAVQDMVDSVVDISHSARDIKLSLLHALQTYGLLNMY